MTAIQAADGESRARKRVSRIWRQGSLFHNFWRYPRNPAAPRIDRLAGILKQGIVAPASCRDGSVRSDLHIVMNGASIAYDRIVFLHKFGPRSGLYTMSEPGRLTAFVDPALTVLTPQDMGRRWVILCQDEVYVREQVAVEHLTGIAVHPADAPSVLAEFLEDFQRVGIPLYLHDGTGVWPRPE